MKKTTKRFVSFLLATVMMFSMFTFSAAAAGLDASYDSATNIVTVENIPATAGTHYITGVKGTVALDDATGDDIVAFIEVPAGEYSATQEIPVLFCKYLQGRTHWY